MEQEPEKKSQEKFTEKFEKFHDKNYKLLLLIPVTLLIFCIIYMGIFYSQNQDFIYKDISLTGGTSATINKPINTADLKQALSEKLESINTREIYDLATREQIATIIETKTKAEQTKQTLEEYLGYELNKENSSFEFTGSTLSESFYQQLLLSILIAFSFMGWVVFLIFGKNSSLKIILGFFVIFNAIASFKFFSLNIAIISSSIICVSTFAVYFFKSIPSTAVIISAFADILMTLVLVNLLGIQMSSAGIIAFLMLIGYSVDTDILLTTKVLKREGPLNQRIFKAFKTGITMTLTSLLAITFALIIVSSFSNTLTQIFMILAIGLGFDLLNTWITNVSILKWYVKKKNEI